ncbi:MAG: hypothetical protein HQL31_05230 [Planctomycetes bacterium]|nr:hypothetical protein [Planctomycetota bacterium]
MRAPRALFTSFWLAAFILFCPSPRGLRADSDMLRALVPEPLSLQSTLPRTLWGVPEKGTAEPALAVLAFSKDPPGHYNIPLLLELARCFSLKLEIVDLSSPGEVDTERISELLQSHHWDALLFWQSGSFSPLAPALKYEILQNLIGGCGIVTVGEELSPIFRADRLQNNPSPGALGGCPISLGPVPLASAELRHYRIGKGLGIHIPIDSAISTDDGSLAVAHEYWVALLGKALWHVTQRPAKISLSLDSAKPDRIAWTEADALEKKWHIAYPREKPALTVRANWRLRSFAGASLHSGSTTLTLSGANTLISTPLPELGAGNYCLDFFLDTDGKREDFAFTVIQVAPVHEIRISSKAAVVEEGEDLEGEVQVLPVDPTGKPESFDTLILLWLDKDDRVIASKILPGNALAEFSLSTRDLHSIHIRLKASTLRAGRVTGSAEFAFRQLTRRQDSFNIVLQGDMQSIVRPYLWRKLWANGVTSSMSSSRECDLANLSLSPILCPEGGWSGEIDGLAFRFTKDSALTVRSPQTGLACLQPFCWNDPQRFPKLLSSLAPVLSLARERPVYVFNLYEYGSTFACDLDPAGLNSYRDWLKNRYGGTIDKLNETWESAYESWDEVNVLYAGDNQEEEARDEGLWARWLDRQGFAEENFAQTLLTGVRSEAQKYDISARAGLSLSSDLCMDFEKHTRLTGFICHPLGVQAELVRSLKAPGTIHGSWVERNAESGPMRLKSWNLVLSEAPALWWRGKSGSSLNPRWLRDEKATDPDALDGYLSDCALPLRRGLGDLLMRLRSQNDDIAIYHSVNSARLGTLHASRRFSSYTGSHTSFVQLLRDLGYQFIYMTPERIAAGELQKRGIRLLILPFTQSLGQEEINAMRRFTEEGGTLLADLRPGVYSEHGKPVERGLALDLFGIERLGRGTPSKVSGESILRYRRDPLLLDLANNIADADIRPASAEALGSVSGLPVFLVNRLGDGESILLNFDMFRYATHPNPQRRFLTRRFFASLFNTLNLSPHASLEDDHGDEAPNIRLVSWDNGNAKLYALLNTSEKPLSANLVLKSAPYIFSSQGTWERRSDRYEAGTLTSGQAVFLATYPYDPGYPFIRGDRASLLPGEEIVFSLGMSSVPDDEPALFSYSLRLLDPKSRDIDCLPWSVQGRAKGASVRLRTALNDPPGNWRLEVREVTTKRRTIFRFKLLTGE